MRARGPSWKDLAVTTWFWLVFVGTAPLVLLLGAAMFVASPLVDPRRNLLHALISRFGFGYLSALPTCRIRVLGRERLPPPPCVLVANHQSSADIFTAMGLFHPFKFVSKASLFGVPLVGWLMSMAGYVGLERGRTGSARRMLERSRRWLDRGVSVLLFPEGTYREGTELLPFRRGAFQLAIDAGAPVVPVVLRGTTALVPGDRPWLSAGARLAVEVLPPILPADQGEDAQALADRVRSLIASAAA
jgi:1-acyl-sn-glycerol-3-phosphate acyltransferase